MSNSPPPSRHSAPFDDERCSSLQSFSEQRRAEYSRKDRVDHQWPQRHQQQQNIFDVMEADEKQSSTVTPASEVTRESQTLLPSPELQATPLSGQSAFATTNANRGSKGHVPAACVNCQKAHLRCSTQRPCPRCTSMGKADTCVDVQHKKRGRPRLRDGRGLRSDVMEAAPSPRASFERTPSVSQPSSSPIEHLRRSDPPTAIVSHDEESIETTAETNRGSVTKPRERPQQVEHRNQSVPVVQGRFSDAAIALLNLDLMIVKSSRSLNRALERELELNGRSLLDVVPDSARERVLKLRCQLRDESHYQDPDYSRFSGRDELRLIHSVDEADIEKATQGFHDRFERLPIRFADGQCREVMVVFRLARTTVFFVTLVLPHSPLESRTGPMLPSIMQVEHAQQLNQSPATLPSLGNLPIHTPPISSVPPNPASPYYFTQGPRVSVSAGDPRPLQTNSHSSRSHHHSTTSIASASTNPGAPSLKSSRPEGHKHFGTGYRELGYDELRNLQLPPLLSASSSVESNDDCYSSRGEGSIKDQSHNPSGGRSTKRERVDIEEMID